VYQGEFRRKGERPKCSRSALDCVTSHFLLGLQKAGVRFVAADMPEANEMVVGIMAVVAQAERKMISVCTKSALAAAKARGVKLGGVRHRKIDGAVVTVSAEASAAGRATKTAQALARAADVHPIIADIQAGGAKSLRENRRES
jgi:DNA invertase Pin-like site-specific DNA recombinase